MISAESKYEEVNGTIISADYEEEVFRSIAHHFEQTRFGRGRAGDRPFTMEKKCLRKAEEMLGVSK